MRAGDEKGPLLLVSDLDTAPDDVPRVAQTFNAFYHRSSILNEEDADRKRWRAAGVAYVRRELARALDLMGIDVPARM